MDAMSQPSASTAARMNHLRQANLGMVGKLAVVACPRFAFGHPLVPQ